MSNWIRFNYAAGNVGGWAGWYEDAAGNVMAFVDVDGNVLRMEDVTF